MQLDEIVVGARLMGVIAAGPVEVLNVTVHGDVATIVFREPDGTLGQRLVTSEEAESFGRSTGQRWTFDADGGNTSAQFDVMSLLERALPMLWPLSDARDLQELRLIRQTVGSVVLSPTLFDELLNGDQS